MVKRNQYLAFPETGCIDNNRNKIVISDEFHRWLKLILGSLLCGQYKVHASH